MPIDFKSFSLVYSINLDQLDELFSLQLFDRPILDNQQIRETLLRVNIFQCRFVDRNHLMCVHCVLCIRSS